MLLNIYLVTTAISWAIVLITNAAWEKRLERKGYKFVKEKRSISEKVQSFLINAFKVSIPVYNILNTIVILWIDDKLYEYMENELLEEGKIYIPTKKIPSSEYKILPKEEIKNTESIERKYAEMTLEEKLAYLKREKEVLASHLEQPTEDIDEFNQEQKGPVLKKTFYTKRK